MLELIFIIMVAVLLVADYAYHKESESTFKDALGWTGVYVLAALLFACVVWVVEGSGNASLFLTGYTLEKVLAFDNLFVFTLIISYFGIPDSKQHAVLHYGIIGAIVFRLIFTAIGVGFMETFGPLFDLVFAGLIIYSCYLMTKGGEEPDYDKIWWVIKLRKLFPRLSVFWICVVVLEISDILFAADSVPAIIAVTKDPFLIYSAMIFAILGLRSLYFVIAAMAEYLYYMETAILWVLGFISIKLIVGALFSIHVSPLLSLFIIISILSLGVAASIHKEVEK